MKRQIAIIITFVLIAPKLFSQTGIDYNLSSGYTPINAFAERNRYSNFISYTFGNSLSFTVKKNNFIFSYGIGLQNINTYGCNRDDSLIRKGTGSYFVLDLPLKFGFRKKFFDYFFKFSLNSLFFMQSSYHTIDISTNRIVNSGSNSDRYLLPFYTAGIGLEKPFRERITFYGGVDISLFIIYPLFATTYLGIKFKLND